MRRKLEIEEILCVKSCLKYSRSLSCRFAILREEGGTDLVGESPGDDCN